MGPDALARAVGVALSLQLVLAAGAVSRPWAVVADAAPLRAAPAVAPAEPAVTAVQAAPARPVGLSAPALWTGEAPLGRLGVAADGTLDVPATEDELGWWADGPVPGAQGAAVVVGHVDLDRRPGRFARLAQARPGTVVTVTAADGSRTGYRVASVEQHRKDAFPADRVYRPVTSSELWLITCGGRFDPRSGHYEDNVVVRAVRI